MKVTARTENTKHSGLDRSEYRPKPQCPRPKVQPARVINVEIVRRREETASESIATDNEPATFAPAVVDAIAQALLADPNSPFCAALDSNEALRDAVFEKLLPPQNLISEASAAFVVDDQWNEQLDERLL